MTKLIAVVCALAIVGVLAYLALFGRPKSRRTRSIEQPEYTDQEKK